MGDLPNLVVNAAGTGSFEATIAHGRLFDGSAPLLDADGAAVVVHAGRDDFTSQPAGNSGARIACGIVEAR